MIQVHESKGLHIFCLLFFRVKEGVLQGSVLSNACFAVTIYSIIDEVSGPACASLFVDELSIFVFSCNVYDAESA